MQHSLFGCMPVGTVIESGSASDGWYSYSCLATCVAHIRQPACAARSPLCSCRHAYLVILKSTVLSDVCFDPMRNVCHACRCYTAVECLCHYVSFCVTCCIRTVRLNVCISMSQYGLRFTVSTKTAQRDSATVLLRRRSYP